MNKQTLLIIAGLALPVIALAMLISYASPQKDRVTPPAATARQNTPTRPPGKTLEQVRQETRNWIEQLKTMTPERWEELRRQNPKRPATSAEALQRQYERLERLEKMTEEEWNARQRTWRNNRQQQQQQQPPQPQQQQPQPQP